MDGCSTCTATAAYSVAVARKQLDSDKVMQAQVAQLIESAAAPQPAPLPPDATFSSYA